MPYIICDCCLSEFDEQVLIDKAAMAKPVKLSNSRNIQKDVYCPVCKDKACDKPLIYRTVHGKVSGVEIRGRVPANSAQEALMVEAGTWPPENWPTAPHTKASLAEANANAIEKAITIQSAQAAL